MYCFMTFRSLYYPNKLGQDLSARQKGSHCDYQIPYIPGQQISPHGHQIHRKIGKGDPDGGPQRDDPLSRDLKLQPSLQKKQQKINLS